VPFRSDQRDGVNCRMLQPNRNRSTQAVTIYRMTNLFKEFLLKIVSSQFKRLNLGVSESRIIVW